VASVANARRVNREDNDALPLSGFDGGIKVGICGSHIAHRIDATGNEDNLATLRASRPSLNQILSMTDMGFP
jgi:hypothetical protein